MKEKTSISGNSKITVGFLAALSFVLGACAAMEEKPMMEKSEPEPTTSMAEPEPIMASDDYHVVQSGESLWSISGLPAIYNDPYRWPLIYGRNKDIEDADLIYPNQELAIPRDLTRTDIDGAVNHARTRGAWSIGEAEQVDLDYRASMMQ